VATNRDGRGNRQGGCGNNTRNFYYEVEYFEWSGLRIYTVTGMMKSNLSGITTECDHVLYPRMDVYGMLPRETVLCISFVLRDDIPVASFPCFYLSIVDD
jgi:hypothetical protein